MDDEEEGDPMLSAGEAASLGEPALKVGGCDEPKRLMYQPQLDGVRALAVLAVVAAHTGAPIFKGGALGVDVFFVLSGFLITTLLVEEFDRNQGVSLRRFYVRRCLRLLPALIAVLCFVVIVFPIISPTFTGETLLGVPTSLFYVASWWRALEVSNLGWLGHTWSLSVEEHFYVVWPLVVLLGCKFARPRIGAWVGGLCLAAAGYRAISDVGGASASRLFNGPDMRAEQLLAGCLLAVVVMRARSSPPRTAVHRAWTVLFLASIIFLVGLVAVPDTYFGLRYSGTTATHYYYNGFSTLVAVAAALVIGHLVVWDSGWLARLLSFPALVWLGRRSYAIYLWHVPLFGLFFLEGRPNSFRFLARLLLIPVTFAIADVSFRFVEAPFLRRQPDAPWVRRKLEQNSDLR